MYQNALVSKMKKSCFFIFLLLNYQPEPASKKKKKIKQQTNKQTKPSSGSYTFVGDPFSFY